jgi:broad specificity phosphatase PhoE
MKPVLRVMAALLVLAVSGIRSPVSGLAQEPTTVIVVRHAERAAEPAGDPVLTEAGQARAQALARVLADGKVGAIITTQWKRTQLTAEPLAQALGLTPVIVPAGGAMPAHIQAVVDAVRRFPGRTILVVGHSNTVPKIVTALGGPQLADFCDNEYANLFTIVIRANGDVSVIRSRYGAEDGPPPANCPAR